MGTAYANGVWLPGDLEPIDWHVTPGIVGAAAAFAAEGRTDGKTSPRLFGASSATEADAVKAATDRVGDQIYRSDVRWIEELTAFGWRIVQTFVGVAFTPPWDYTRDGISISPGTVQDWRYWISGNEVTIEGSVRWGDGAPDLSVSGRGVYIAVPAHLPVAQVPENYGVKGSSLCTIGGSERMGHVTGRYTAPNSRGADDSTARRVSLVIRFMRPSGNGSQAGAAAEMGGMSNVNPAEWTINSSFAVQFSYYTSTEGV